MNDSGKMRSFFNGAGFYIVLLLTILVIGASGYFIYRTLSVPSAPKLPLEDSRLTAAEPAPEHPVPADSPAPIPEEPETETVPVTGTTQVPEEEASQTPPRLVHPLSGEIAAAFSMETLVYNETMGDWRTHDGVDIAAEEGCEVVSAADGKITAVVDDYWMGTTVTVAGSDGCELTYASLQKGVPVAAGDAVKAGEVIGSVGTTALLEEDAGPHLHFSVTQDGTPIDPTVYLSRAE